MEIIVKKAEYKDRKSIVNLLNFLSDTSNLTDNEIDDLWWAIYSSDSQLYAAWEWIEEDGDEWKGRIIGTATLILETKFIHNGGCVGHIEDVVVHPDFRGKKVGQQLIHELVREARLAGAYKVILNCTPDNIPFYEKCGFTNNGVVQMRKDLI
jgi:glucosamine-phosphate N-acetyltransferase